MQSVKNDTTDLKFLEKSSSNLPLVSVIMPVRNEADFIERSLASVLQQNYPHELLEIVIADGASTDDTLDRILKMSAHSDIKVKTVQNPKRIAPAALNIAIANALGDIFVRVDGHCEIESDYVANCVKHLTSGNADGVGGPIETIGDGLQGEAIALAMSSKFGVGGSAFRTVHDREMYTDSVAFPGYTRKMIERAGPFNEELVRNQDDEYNYRIRKLGGRILLSPDIRSKYYSRSTFSSLWSQYLQYGYWKVSVLRIHPKQMSPRQFVPFIFIFSTLILGILSIFFDAPKWAFVGIVVVYLAANLVASSNIARTRIRMVPFLSSSFAILHVSYGLGFLLGIAAIVPRRKSAVDAVRPCKQAAGSRSKR